MDRDFSSWLVEKLNYTYKKQDMYCPSIISRAQVVYLFPSDANYPPRHHAISPLSSWSLMRNTLLSTTLASLPIGLAQP